MRDMDSYGLKLCEFQAKLFEKSIDKTECSSPIFLRRYMNSDLAMRMDKEGFLFESIDDNGAFLEIESEFGKSTYGKKKYGVDEMYWMGYIYRYWAYIKNISSKRLYHIIGPEEMKKLYFPYHSLDPKKAIERIEEAKGLNDDDMISRGVVVLRNVRKKYSNMQTHVM